MFPRYTPKRKRCGKCGNNLVEHKRDRSKLDPEEMLNQGTRAKWVCLNVRGEEFDPGKGEWKYEQSAGAGRRHRRIDPGLLGAFLREHERRVQELGDRVAAAQVEDGDGKIKHQYEYKCAHPSLSAFSHGRLSTRRTHTGSPAHFSMLRHAEMGSGEIVQAAD